METNQHSQELSPSRESQDANKDSSSIREHSSPNDNSESSPELAAHVRLVKKDVVYKNNPGQAYGIIGIILSCIGLSFFGLILGIVSFKVSKKVGASTKIGRSTIIFSSIVMVLTVLVSIFYVIPAFQSMQDSAKQAAGSAQTRQP